MYLISIIIIFQYLKHSRKRLYKGYANPEAKFSIYPKVTKTFFLGGVLAGSGCCHLHTVYAQKYIYRVLQNSSPGILSECYNPCFFFLICWDRIRINTSVEKCFQIHSCNHLLLVLTREV